MKTRLLKKLKRKANRRIYIHTTNIGFIGILLEENGFLPQVECLNVYPDLNSAREDISTQKRLYILKLLKKYKSMKNSKLTELEQLKIIILGLIILWTLFMSIPLIHFFQV